MNLKVGDWVSWNTYLGSISVKKRGSIVLILDAGEDFYEAVEGLKKHYRFNIIHNKERARDYLSYIVLVRDGEGIPRLYWPEVNSLKKIRKVVTKCKRKIKEKRSKK